MSMGASGIPDGLYQKQPEGVELTPTGKEKKKKPSKKKKDKMQVHERKIKKEIEINEFDTRRHVYFSL